MDLDQFVGMPSLDGNFDNYYETAVQKLGGPKALRKYVPFTLKTLRESYAKDEHFNTSLTPMRKWDDASGVYAAPGRPTVPPSMTGYGLAPFLYAHGVNWVAQSQAVCLLKTAARMLVLEADHPETISDGTGPEGADR